jgi:hypothetical protein
MSWPHYSRLHHSFVLPSPHRHVGFSPFHKQISKRIAVDDPIAIQKYGNDLSGLKMIDSTAIEITHGIITAHPCHEHGRPQPQPCFFAGNQILFELSFIRFLSTQQVFA